MNSFSHDKNEYICIRSFFMQSREVRMEKEAKTQKDMESLDVEETKNEQIKDFGQAILHANRNEKTIYLLSIIGEIEGHECLPSTAKTTKYEHVLPKLAAIEDDSSVDGVLLILNTMGGDVESGSLPSAASLIQYMDFSSSFGRRLP